MNLKGSQERKPSPPPEVSQMKVAEVVFANQQTKPKVMQTQDGGIDRRIQMLLRWSRHKSKQSYILRVQNTGWSYG